MSGVLRVARRCVLVVFLGACADAPAPVVGGGWSHPAIPGPVETALWIVLDGPSAADLEQAREEGIVPHLAALAGRVHVSAGAPAARAVPALASIETGLTPHTHGLHTVFDRGLHGLGPDVATVFERARAALPRVRALAYLALPELVPEISQLGRGAQRAETFDALLVAVEEAVRGDGTLLVEAVFSPDAESPDAESAAQHLSRRLSDARPRNARIDAAFELEGAEAQVAALEKALARGRGTAEHAAWKQGMADARLAAVDRRVGALVAALGERADGALTLVCGLRATAGARVPLWVSSPYHAAGEEAAEVRTTDVAPTVLGFLGVSPEGCEGRVLFPEPGSARGEAPPLPDAPPAGVWSVEGRGLEVRWSFAGDGPVTVDGVPGEASGRTRIATGGGHVELETEPAERPLELRLVAEDGLSPAGVLVGDTLLSHALLPRLPLARGRAWDAGEPSPEVTFEHEGSHWWKVSVEGISGRAVRGLVVLHPASLDARLAADAADGAFLTPVAGRLDALWFEGETPLSFQVQRTPGQELACAVEVGGQVVPRTAMQWQGRHFGAPDELRLLLPDWVPGVTACLARGLDAPLAADTVRIGRTGRGVPDAERRPLDAERLARLARFEEER